MSARVFDSQHANWLVKGLLLAGGAIMLLAACGARIPPVEQPPAMSAQEIEQAMPTDAGARD